MHYPNDPSVLEASDIAAAYQDGVVTFPDGRIGVKLVAIINPLVNKIYSDKLLPESLFVTNGVYPRRMPLTPLADAMKSPPAQGQTPPETKGDITSPDAQEVGKAGEPPAEANAEPGAETPANLMAQPATTPPQPATDQTATPIVTEVQPADQKDAAIAAKGQNPLPESAASKQGARTQSANAPSPEHPADAFSEKNEPK